MSHAFSSPAFGATFGRSASSGWMEAVAAGLARLRRIAERRQALASLQTMDDGGLADLGLSRGALEDAVRHGRPDIAHRPARRPPARALPAAVATEWR